MRTRLGAALVVMSVLTGACGHLGLGEVDCTSPERAVSSATILTVQAVPSAKYTPCINNLRLGWDQVQWYAEDGEAGIIVQRSVSPFLTVTVTESCDVEEARPVASGHPDIERYEDIDFLPEVIGITIVPSGELPRIYAQTLVERLAGTEIDDRPVEFTIDDHMIETVTSRTNLALLRGQYVWIVDALDQEEGTVELRSNQRAVAGSGLTPPAALDLIEDHVPDVHYRGEWYFVFDGGCITYEFDAKGSVAETVAADAEDAFGFYPAYELREGARRAGYDIGGTE